MRHRVSGKEFNRNKAHRKALFRNLIDSLILYGRITTTLAKAKALRPKIEKLITVAKKSQELSGAAYVHNFRRVLSIVQDRGLAKKLFTDIAERFDQRNGGYTRIMKLGASRWEEKGRGKVAFNRLGDNAKMAVIELVERKEKGQELYSAGRGTLARQEKELGKTQKPKKQPR